MVQGLLTLDDDDHRHRTFSILQLLVAGILIAVAHILYGILHVHQKGKAKTSEGYSCESYVAENSKRENNGNDSSLQCQCDKPRKKFLREQRPRRKRDFTEETAQMERICQYLIIEKLLQGFIKYKSSRSWKTFRRKKNNEKKMAKKKRKGLRRLNKRRIGKEKRRKKNKPSPEREIRIRKLLENFFKEHRCSFFQSKDKKYISKFTPILDSLLMSVPSILITLCPVYRSLDSYFQTALSSGDTSISQRMCYEWLRFMSFAAFREIPVRPMFLARSGFYATGTDVSVVCVCYSCGVRYASWRADDIPDEIHRRLSPTCLHMTTGDPRNRSIHEHGQSVGSNSPATSGNNPSHAQETPDHETNSISQPLNNAGNQTIYSRTRETSQDRIHHQSTLQITTSLSSVSLSNDGSPLPRESTIVRAHTVVSSGLASLSEPQDPANRSSRTIAPSQQFETTSPLVPQSQVARLDPLGINFDRPRYPAYAVLSVRISSFQGWPPHHTQTPRLTAMAGFFYAGYGDYVRCFFCGGGLRNWEPGDDPWVEHARWFPRCAFLRQNKGDSFVQLVQEEHNRIGDSNEENEAPSSGGDIGDGQRHTAIATLQEMGYSAEDIQTAITRFEQKHRESQAMSATILVDLLTDTEGNVNETTEDNTTGNTNSSIIQNGHERLVRENRRLREQRLCRICQDQDATIALLPCGHLICCPDCAPAMRRCPVCKEFVKGTVKTYLV